MKHTERHQKNFATQAGFTVVECLIGLAISAMLMTALAVAFNASIINFRENEAMFESINGARQALTRMTSQLRTADGVQFAAPSNQCVFLSGTTTPELLTYEYRSADSKLYLIKNATGSEYTLCDNVTAASFTKTLAESDPNGIDSKSVLISLTVQNGGGQRTLSAAAVVRRALAM